MNIDSFKDAVGGGVRNALFRVNGFIGNQGADNAVSFLCTAAQLPTSTLGQTTAPYRGRNIKIPTSRTFEDWTITILSDRNLTLRSKFEQWVDSINGSRDNVEQVQDAVTDLSTAFFTDWYVDQLDRSGKAIKSYQFKYCFPTTVSSVDLSAESEELQNFSVSLAYSYFLTTGVSTGGNASTGIPGALTPATQ
jgi:hypothetical protein|tara:strand:+ start:566 stop:1144 length:579 start_codon:yes stop_codon:yes gene_type:complete